MKREEAISRLVGDLSLSNFVEKKVIGKKEKREILKLINDIYNDLDEKKSLDNSFKIEKSSED
jgi:hypothetical protein